MDDLAVALQLTPVLKAFFREVGIAADAESFYLSSRYRRDGRDDSDSVAIVCNLSVET